MKTLFSINASCWIKAAILGILISSVYYSTLLRLTSYEWTREDFSYCWIIPLISIYLIWEKKDKIISLPSVPTWKGILIFFVALFLFWIGELGGQYFILYISFWLSLVGLCWMHLGWKKIKTFYFAFIIALGMFPIPNFFFHRASLSLKLISSQIGVGLMRLYGMSAYREGNVIDLGFTQLQVIDACSGLRYLFPLIILGILLAYFFKTSWYKRVFLVISTIPISIVVNGVRIATVGVLYPNFGKAVAEGFFHDFSGWFIFMVSLGILLLEMWLLKKVPGSRFKVQGEGQRTGASAEGVKRRNGESGRREPKAEEKGVRGFLSPPQFVVAVVLLGITLVLSQGVEFREKIPINKSFDEFPLQVGEWSGSRQTMEQKFLDELDLSDYVIVNYQNKQKKDVEFYVAYYQSQRKGESIHSPATCLSGGGWIFNQAGKIDILFSTKSGVLMPVKRAFIQKGDYKQLTYYWFPMRGRILTNAYQMKIYNFWDALTQQRTDGALVRIITPVYKNEEVKDAEERLQGFVGEIVPVLNEYLPQ